MVQFGKQDWKQAACDLASLVKRNKEDKHLRNIYNHVSGVWKRSRLFSLSFDRQLVNIKDQRNRIRGDIRFSTSDSQSC